MDILESTSHLSNKFLVGWKKQKQPKYSPQRKNTDCPIWEYQDFTQKRNILPEIKICWLSMFAQTTNVSLITWQFITEIHTHIHMSSSRNYKVVANILSKLSYLHYSYTHNFVTLYEVGFLVLCLYEKDSLHRSILLYWKQNNN